MKKKSARMPFATAAVIAFAGTVLGIAQAAWSLTAEQVARLKQIFPEGVCDYSKPDQARPRHR